MAYPLPDKPSIAVLAFTSLGTDPDDEFLADSFSEDILTSLSKLSGLLVISRTTSFTYKGKGASVKQIAEDLGIRYVLEGSILRDGDRIRVTAQLIDAIGGQRVWADRYDRDLSDLFAVKDDITLNIISNISAELIEGERDRVVKRETESLEAWLLFKQEEDQRTLLTAEAVALSKDLLQRAVAIDPNFISAIASLGASNRVQAQLGHTDTPQAFYDRAGELYARALALDPDHAYTISFQTTLSLALRQFDLALEFGQRAVDLDPNSNVAHFNFSRALSAVANAEGALREARLAIRLSPVAPHYILVSLGEALAYSGLFEEAVVEFEKVLNGSPSTLNEAWASANLALALDALGREEEAREHIARAVELAPMLANLRAWNFLMLGIKDQGRIDEDIATLRRLGMPE
jgi:adenylate cyclase